MKSFVLALSVAFLSVSASALSVQAATSGVVAKSTTSKSTTVANPTSDLGAHSQMSASNSFWENIGNRTDLSYFVQFNGPALGRPLIEAHTTSGEGGPWPISLYHDAVLEFHPTHNFSFGLELAASQDLASGVTSNYGNQIIPTFTIFQPSLFFKHSSIVETSWLRVAGAINLMLPTSEYAQDERVLGGVAFDQTWNIKLPDHRWQLYFTTRLQPTFYQYELPSDYTGFQRETFFVSAGHYVGYHFNRNWELSNSSLFDANHMSNDAQGLFNFGSASEDRTQLQLTYYHSSGWFYAGALVQSVIAHPRLNTSVVGAVLKINFTRARY